MVDGRSAAGVSSSGRKRQRGARDTTTAPTTTTAIHSQDHVLQQDQQHDVAGHGFQGNEGGFEEEDADEDGDQEARIRALVFGKGENSLLTSFGSEAKGKSSLGSGGSTAEGVSSSTAFERGFYQDSEGDDVLVEGAVETVPVGGKKIDGPAWVDEDDASLKVDISAKNRLKKLRQNKQEGELTGPEFEERLRNRFASSNMTADWVKAAEENKKVSTLRRVRDGDASSDDEDGEFLDRSEDEGDTLLRDSKGFKGEGGSVLEPGYLDIVRCKDANQHEPAKAVVRAVSFHPTGEILLTAGFDKTLRLFQVDGVRNTKVHSIFFEDLPITNAMFTGKDEAVIAGRRPFFYWYDVATGKVQKIPRVFSSGRAEKHMETFAVSPDGKWLAFIGSGGYILLLSNKTKQWAADFKLNSPATAVSFTPDSGYVLASGADADVYKFDIRSRRCVLRFFNEGGTRTTSIAVSPSSSSNSNRLLAVGSDSGVVNVYDVDALESGKRVLRPSPLKAVMSLTTPVTTAKFSHDGQMLAIASNQKRDSLKVIHSASCTPFSNWPTERTPTRYPFALDFSPGGGFVAVGNDRGCVLLYRIRHYPQA